MTREIRVCGSDEIGEGEVKGFDVNGRRVAIVRLGGELHAVDDTCSHEDYSLSEGEVDPDECTIECWKHGSLFDLRTGEALTLPATRPVPVYEVKEDGDDVKVVLG